MFKFMLFTFIKNVLNLVIFIHVPLTTQNSPPNSYDHTVGRGKLFLTPGYRKYEADLEHWLFVILSNVMALRFVNNIYHIVWYYLPIVCNHDNLILKRHQKK